MAAPSLSLNEDINKCFSELSESCEQNIIGINKFKEEIEKLKVKPEGRVTTGKVNQWLSNLESLEGQAASILENIKRISFGNTIKIGPWGGPGARSFDFWEWAPIVNVKVYTGDVIHGLEITYVDGKTYPVGRCVGESHEFELKYGEYMDGMFGFIKNYCGEICVSELGFKTNFGNKYGPFGHAGGEEFTVPFKAGSRIVGFFGQYSSLINSIGVYLASV